jgi:hypothetical protein
MGSGRDKELSENMRGISQVMMHENCNKKEVSSVRQWAREGI